MTRYINKADVVAEIERRIKECDKLADAAADNNLSNTQQANELLIRQYTSLLDFIDTLEVKEVDLEKYYHDFLQKELFDKDCNRTVSEMMAFTAKHFYELGFKAQKGVGFLRNIPNSNYTCEEMADWVEKQGNQREQLINKACDVLVNCIEDYMLRRMEVWNEEDKKQTLENIRKKLEE